MMVPWQGPKRREGVAEAKPIRPTKMTNISTALHALQNDQAVLAIQALQNQLRDLRDSDPQDNDVHWYAIIDGISDQTGISPQ